ncbi:MAG: hypothetical protein WC307_06705 [Candidatus Nanoarchaeia archaeon]|jgi:hypothetical protein
MDKWIKHKGITTIKLGEDSFDLKISNSELPQFIELSKLLGRTGGELNTKINELISDLCVNGLINANEGIDKEVINTFVKENQFKLTIALLKWLNE